jgi:hypothetical protein
MRFAMQRDGDVRTHVRLFSRLRERVYGRSAMLARPLPVLLLLVGCASTVPLTPTAAPATPAASLSGPAEPSTVAHKRRAARLGPPFAATNGARHVPFDAVATAYAATP